MDKNKCIIFGTGSSGKMAYYKLKDKFEIIAYSDNNKDKWNTSFIGIEVISPEKIKMKIDNDRNIEIYVASQFYKEICEQLVNMGICNIKYINEGLIWEYPIKRKIKLNYIDNRRLKKVLFVQKDPCIRTYKLSTILNNLGIEVDLAYFTSHPNMVFGDQKLPWTQIYPINDLNEFMDFVNESDYDLIHNSNAPDTLAVLLLHSNKKVVHDIHDLETFRAEVDFDKRVLEKVAVTYSDAIITAGAYYRNYIIEKYRLMNKKILSLNNFPLKSFKPEKIFEKLSCKDSELHCVYEGCISSSFDVYGHRFFEDLFLEIAKKNIHLHFYSGSNDIPYLKHLESLHPYLHYEGNKAHMDLISELTKYDVGILCFNANASNYMHVSFSSGNKFYDYLSAGIPVAVSYSREAIELANKYNVGRELIFDDTLKEQLTEISKLKVEDNFLEKHKFTLDSYKEEILQFYESVM